MPRPSIGRKVCCLPESTRFGPLDSSVNAQDAIILTVDEYEVIRLIDVEELQQEACAQRMGVARSTVQLMYQQARKKIGEAIVNTRPLFIEGGNYRLYEEHERASACGPCHRLRCRGRRSNR